MIHTRESEFLPSLDLQERAQFGQNHILDSGNMSAHNFFACANGCSTACRQPLCRRLAQEDEMPDFCFHLSRYETTFVVYTSMLNIENTVDVGSCPDVVLSSKQSCCLIRSHHMSNILRQNSKWSKSDRQYERIVNHLC